jgi:hypothetical protein
MATSSHKDKMKVLDLGHRYELANFEQKDQPGQVLQFIKKSPRAPGSSDLETIADGTTNEEVLEMMLDRLNHLQEKMACRENAIAITHIQTALLFLNHRTAQRVKRGVEGTHKP